MPRLDASQTHALHFHCSFVRCSFVHSFVAFFDQSTNVKTVRAMNPFVIFANLLLTAVPRSVTLNPSDSASSLFRPHCFASRGQWGFLTALRSPSDISTRIRALAIPLKRLQVGARLFRFFASRFGVYNDDAEFVGQPVDLS
jgi:hypothetical protein